MRPGEIFHFNSVRKLERKKSVISRLLSESKESKKKLSHSNEKHKLSFMVSSQETTLNRIEKKSTNNTFRSKVILSPLKKSQKSTEVASKAERYEKRKVEMGKEEEGLGEGDVEEIFYQQVRILQQFKKLGELSK